MSRAAFISVFFLGVTHSYAVSAAEQKSNVGNPAAVGENIQRIRENQAKEQKLDQQYQKMVPNKDRPQEKK